MHTVLRLERNSWPGRISVNIYEKACGLFNKSHPGWDKEGVVVWNTELILTSLDPGCSLCVCDRQCLCQQWLCSFTFVWHCWSGSKGNYSITATIRAAGSNMTHAIPLIPPCILCSVYRLKATTLTFTCWAPWHTRPVRLFWIGWKKQISDIRHSQDNCFYRLVTFKQEKMQSSLMRRCICACKSTKKNLKKSPKKSLELQLQFPT